MYAHRLNESHIFTSFEQSRISVVLGPRRVGKTTIVSHYKKLHPDRQWVFLPMDNRELRKRIANNELEILIEEEALTPIKQANKIWVAIDEAQKCSELFDQIKEIYDAYEHQNKIKFILTGSAQLDLHQLTAESLAGRVELNRLREFCLREICRLNNPSTNIPSLSSFDRIFGDFKKNNLSDLYLTLRPFNKQLNSELSSYLIWGGLPEVHLEKTSEQRWQYLRNYLQTYLEKDIRAIDSIGDLDLYHNLMQVAAEQTGSMHNDQKITEALRCSRNTLHKYRNYLKATLQYVEIYPYIGSSVKRLVKTPKAYITNNGLVSYLTGLSDPLILEKTGMLGHRFENWFLNEMNTWLDSQPYHSAIHYWRTSSGVEVDFVVTLGNQIIPFEITYSKKIISEKVRHLNIFLDTYPNIKFGVYVYNGELEFNESKRILFLPAWML